MVCTPAAIGRVGVGLGVTRSGFAMSGTTGGATLAAFKSCTQERGRYGARCRRCDGGQGRPSSAGHGPKADLLGGVPGLQLWIPAGPQPARCAGCSRVIHLRADQPRRRAYAAPSRQSALVSEPFAQKPTNATELASHERCPAKVFAGADCSSSMAGEALSRHSPTVGAGCPNWARPDLCRRRPERDVPAAIAGPYARQIRNCQHKKALIYSPFAWPEAISFVISKIRRGQHPCRTMCRSPLTLYPAESACHKHEDMHGRPALPNDRH
jgi:hypothetical protein